MSLNILIVDDSDIVRTMIGRTLRLAEIPLGTIHEAGDGQEALDILREHWVDLILADINMPVMDGMEMLARLKEDGVLKSIPVVVVSTDGSRSRADELEAMGVAAYVRKPFTPEAIRDVVLDCLGVPDESDHSAVVTEVFGEVLERFAFMFGEPAPAEDLPGDGSPRLAARIAFKGGLTGTLTLVVPERLCPEIAANVLGIELGDSVGAGRSTDALKELANITCGSVLSTLAEDHVAFDLSVPLVSPFDAEEWEAMLGAPGTAALLVDESPVLLNLSVKAPGG